MKKFLKVLSAVAIAIVSFATVASATITNDIYKPEWNIVVDSVEEGVATINISIEFDTELAYTQNGSGLTATYTGYGLTMTDLLFTLDPTIFDTEVYAGGADFGEIEFNGEMFYASHLWLNKIAEVKVGKTINHGILQVMLKEDYLNITAAELNAMAFATVTKAGLQIGHWDNVKGNKAVITSFYSDGSAAFDCAYVVGKTAPAPTASVDVTGAFQTTDADWVAANGKTIYWGVDFANGGFNGTAVAKIFNEAGDERILNIVQDGEINGDASFGVFAILGDKTDALKLTVTSGDVTDTADAFVAAE